MQTSALNLREVGIKGVGRAWVREGTSDLAVLQQIFEARLLDVMASRHSNGSDPDTIEPSVRARRH